MAKKPQKGGKRVEPSTKSVTRRHKSDDHLECFYCGGLVKEWNWKCPHCGKLFNSGKRAFVLFVTVLLVSVLIGTSMIWYPALFPERRIPNPLFIDEVHPAAGNTTAWVRAQPDVWFNLTHVLKIALDRESCERAHSIEPQLNGHLEWAGWAPNYNIMIMAPDDRVAWEGWLQPETVYYVNITNECHDVEGNHLQGNQPDGSYRFWFKTE